MSLNNSDRFEKDFGNETAKRTPIIMPSFDSKVGRLMRKRKTQNNSKTVKSDVEEGFNLKITANGIRKKRYLNILVLSLKKKTSPTNPRHISVKYFKKRLAPKSTNAIKQTDTSC